LRAAHSRHATVMECSRRPRRICSRWSTCRQKRQARGFGQCRPIAARSEPTAAASSARSAHHLHGHTFRCSQVKSDATRELGGAAERPEFRDGAAQMRANAAGAAGGAGAQPPPAATQQKSNLQPLRARVDVTSAFADVATPGGHVASAQEHAVGRLSGRSRWPSDRPDEPDCCGRQARGVSVRANRVGQPRKTCQSWIGARGGRARAAPRRWGLGDTYLRLYPPRQSAPGRPRIPTYPTRR
jgi:hypothetical protein